jgi:transcriptional regulator with XRE-family HTH domain
MQSRVEISRATWSNYENGVTEPPFDKLIEIAKFFRISLDQLLLHDLSEEEAPQPLKSQETPISERKRYDDSTGDSPESQENEETTLWYLLREIKAIRKDMDKLRKKAKE